MHVGGYLYSRVELLTPKGAEKTTVASAADCEVEADSLTAGHERKHNACRAALEFVLVVIRISAEYKRSFAVARSLTEEYLLPVYNRPI